MTGAPLGEPAFFEAMQSRLARLRARIDALATGAYAPAVSGAVCGLASTTVTVRGIGPFSKIGDLVEIDASEGPSLAVVVRIGAAEVAVAPFGRGIAARLGDPVRITGSLDIRPHVSWKGRVVDALARSIDGGTPLAAGRRPVSINATPPRPMRRGLIHEPFLTGVAAIDLFTPMCLGQRIGIFAGSGVGKSMLLAMLATAPEFDSIVLALVGERGREVREFIESTLAKSRSRAITIVASSDDSAMMRRLAPRTAMAIAEHLRDNGEKVLLIIDSLTRLAHAEREFALAAGEPPVARGYPPSVFRELANLVERAGIGEGRGSITAIASVLVDGDDHNDPVADAVRGLLDGHIVLDRGIAAEGRYPAIDILASVSRLASRAASPARVEAARQLRHLAARFEDTRDLRAINGHRAGLDATLDRAVAVVPRLYDLLRQTSTAQDQSQINAALALLDSAPSRN